MLLKDIIGQGTNMLSVIYPAEEARQTVFAYLEDVLGVRRHTHIVEPDYQVPEESVQEILAAFERMSAGEPLQYILAKAWFYGRQFRVTSDVLIPRPETELLVNSILSQSAGARCSDGPLPAVAGPLPPSLLPQAAHCKSPQGCLPIVCDGGEMPSPHKWHTASREQNLLILDLCTGSGCIAWTLALEIPGARVTAVDISEGALSVASSQDFSEEIARTGARKPVFVKADVLSDNLVTTVSDNLKECVSEQSSGCAPLRFDIIVSNPPYVMDSEKALMRSNVLDHEPHLALFVPDDDALKFYSAIASHSVRLLSEEGFGIVEINEALGEATAEIFRAAGFAAKVMQDLSGKDRFVSFSKKNIYL